MKLLSCVVSLFVVGVVATTALAGPAPREAEGHLYRVSTSAAEVYWIEGGARRHVPDPATLKGIFVDNPPIDVDAAASTWDEKAPLPQGAVLTKSPELPAVYLIDWAQNGGPAVRRHIVSPAAAAKYHLDLGKVQVCPTSFMLLKGISTGSDLP
jgi:hypothetical protein